MMSTKPTLSTPSPDNDGLAMPPRLPPRPPDEEPEGQLGQLVFHIKKTSEVYESQRERRDKLLAEVPGIRRKDLHSYEQSFEMAAQSKAKFPDDTPPKLTQYVKTAENFFDATKVSNKIKLRPLSPKALKSKKSTSPDNPNVAPSSRGSHFFQTAANGFGALQDSCSNSKSSLVHFFEQHKNSLSNSKMGPPPSRPILKPINAHSTASNWTKRELSLPHKKQEVAAFPRGSSQRPMSRKLGDEQHSIYQLTDSQNDPYAFRATASGSQGFWNQTRSTLRSGGGNYHITRSLHNSEERRGSHHQFSQKMPHQSSNIYAGSSSGFQGAGSGAAKFRAKKRSYGEALPPSEVIPEIGEYSSKLPADLSPADHYYGGGFSRQALNNSVNNGRPSSKPAGKQSRVKKELEGGFMLKRQAAPPTLAELGKQEQIQFDRNEKVDVRGLLTSQQEPGVNLFFYDWNNNSGDKGGRERGASRGGKRNTSSNFYKDRTPKAEEETKQQKQQQQQQQESPGTGTGGRKVSPRPDSQRRVKKAKARRGAGAPQINENVLMEEIVEEEVLSPLHH